MAHRTGDFRQVRGLALRQIRAEGYKDAFLRENK